MWHLQTMSLVHQLVVTKYDLCLSHARQIAELRETNEYYFEHFYFPDIGSDRRLVFECSHFSY